MHIELLWLIPITSFAVFLFIVAYYAQKSAERRNKNGELAKQVALFNAGQEVLKPQAAEQHDDRLKELEKAINLVAEMVVHHQRVPEPQTDSSASASEIDELKTKLRTVFKEYDIILSENYTLKAKVKQLSKQLKELQDGSSEATELAVESIEKKSQSTMNMYDDTRLINLAGMKSDDISETKDARPI
jgi:cell division protein FtsB